jgi:hypothetical protein
MGFPQWTIFGMGFSIIGALVTVAYSLYVQSPNRQYLSAQIEPYRKDARVRALTTVAFAFLLLSVGFYVAGVPLGATTSTTAETQSVAEGNGDVAALEIVTVEGLVRTPVTGAMGAPLLVDAADCETPPCDATIPVEESVDSVEPVLADQSAAAAAEVTADQPASTPLPPTDVPTQTPTPTSTPTPLPTNTPTPTQSPTPTLTPTPIDEPTARVNTGGSTLWVKSTPGGNNLILLQDGDTVILMPGNANHTGVIYKQVKTVDGTVGWAQRDFLAFTDTP